MRIAAVILTATMAGAGTASCLPGDFDNSGTVDGADLGLLLSQWNRGESPADLNGDGTVDGADLGILLSNWGGTEVQEAVWLPAGGGPNGWISGGLSCPAEIKMQVHWVNDDYAVIRQSLCTNFEAPFMHLLFGQDKVLMQDTGAGGGIQIYNKVQEVIGVWLQKNRKTSIQLIVSHTHGHGDHISGDSQFNGKPNTTLIGTSQTAVKNFFGITNWPTQTVEYDLGGRVIDIIPIPGHQTAHIAYYDRQTGILFTGDTLYPGRLYISNFNDYVASIDRMVEFVADKPVCWVIGTHIEMSTTPQVDFPIGSTSHPNEHELELTRDHLLELQAALHAMNGVPKYEKHDDFIIFPLGGAANATPLGGSEAFACCDRPKSVFDLKRWDQQAQDRPGNDPK